MRVLLKMMRFVKMKLLSIFVNKVEVEQGKFCHYAALVVMAGRCLTKTVQTLRKSSKAWSSAPRYPVIAGACAPTSQNSRNIF